VRPSISAWLARRGTSAPDNPVYLTVPSHWIWFGLTLADLRQARLVEALFSSSSHSIWSISAVLSAVSHSIWPVGSTTSDGAGGQPWRNLAAVTRRQRLACCAVQADRDPPLTGRL
jgi:hypothetical protein